MNNFTGRVSRSICKGIVFVFLIGILPAVAIAAGEHGLVYEVQSDAVTLYIAGSIHVLRKTDFPLPANMDEVYSKSDALIMELDLDDLDPVESAALISSLAMAPDGESLRSLMGEASYNRSRKSASALGIDLKRLSEVRPWFAALTVLQISLMQAGYSPDTGVEKYFLARATKDHKSVEGLETMSQQLSIFASLSNEEQGLFLEKTLAELGELDEEIGKLLGAWRNGDLPALESLLLDSFDEYPELFEELVNSRNKAWLDQLTGLLDHGNQNYMVIVGAMHLLGEQGVIALLRQKGFAVRRL